MWYSFIIIGKVGYVLSDNKIGLDALSLKTLKFIRQNVNAERNGIKEALSISYPTVIKTISNLSDKKYIDGKTLSISSENRKVFWGISFGTSHVKVCCVDFCFNLLNKSIYQSEFRSIGDTLDDDGSVEGIDEKYLCYSTPEIYDEFVKLINQIVNSIIEFAQNENHGYLTAGIGFAFTGAVDKKNEILKKVINIKYLEDVSLRQIISIKSLQFLEDNSIPIVFDHNAKAAAVAEKEFLYTRSYKEHLWNRLQVSQDKVGNNMLCLFLGTGIGAGLILDNRLYTGTLNFAGEISHFPIFFSMDGKFPIEGDAFSEFYHDKKTVVCSCGSNICLECYIKILDRFLTSTTEDALEENNKKTILRKDWQTMWEKTKSNDDSEDTRYWRNVVIKKIFENGELSDPQIVEQYLVDKIERAYKLLGYLIGYTIISLVNILNIDTVICTGRLTKYYSYIEKYILEKTAQNGVSFTRNCCMVLDSKKGKLAPALGIAIESYFAYIGEEIDWNID